MRIPSGTPRWVPLSTFFLNSYVLHHHHQTGNQEWKSKVRLKAISHQQQKQYQIRLKTDLMTLCIPITNKDCDISIWHWKRQRYNVSVIYGDPPIATSSSLEVQGREVKETPDLIFYLKLICPVPPGRDWTIGPRNTILPRIFSVLYTIPELK